MDKILWKGKDVLKITNGHGPSNWNASGVSIDTRTIKKGDIFLATEFEGGRHQKRINKISSF